jgi:hypothetical protein
MFYYANGQGAASASLTLAAIHAQHQSMGLASTHARYAVQIQNAPDTAQTARQNPFLPLSLNEIDIMLQLQYPRARRGVGGQLAAGVRIT